MCSMIYIIYTCFFIYTFLFNYLNCLEKLNWKKWIQKNLNKFNLENNKTEFRIFLKEFHGAQSIILSCSLQFLFDH